MAMSTRALRSRSRAAMLTAIFAVCPSSEWYASRILVVNREGVVAGLLVDEVFGLRRFKPEEHQDKQAEDTGSLATYLSGMFSDQVRRWNVFSVEKLVRTEQFLRVV